MKSRALRALALIVCLAPASFSQTHSAPAPLHSAAQRIPLPFDRLAPGFAFGTLRTVGLFDACASLANGERVHFDGISVTHVAEDGALIATLGSVPGFVFPSLVWIHPSETFALVGESSNGVIYRVDLALGGLTPLTTIAFNFDATDLNATHVLVTAAICGAGCTTQIYRVNVTTGAQTLVGSVPGPSGPLAISRTGDLYYATASDSFPAPPGSTSILRWTAARVASGTMLSAANASTFATGLDAVTDIAFDPIGHHVFVIESPFASTAHIAEYDAGGNRIGEIVESNVSLSSLEFFDGAGPFAPFQSTTSTTMRYRATHYTAVQFSRIMHVIPQPPLAALTGPGVGGRGEVLATITGAAPNASVEILVCPAFACDERETTRDLGAFSFATSMRSDAARRVVELATDASGKATWSYFASGSPRGARVLQAVVKDAHGIRIASSNAVRD